MPLSAILYILFSIILNSLFVLILPPKVESSLIDNFNLGDFIFDSTFLLFFLVMSVIIGLKIYFSK